MHISAFLTVAVLTATSQAVAIAHANPSPDAAADPEAWCLWHGQSCWKTKRVAEAFSDAIASGGGFKETREAEISNAPGGAAYHAKRAVDELAALIASTRNDSDAWYNNLALFGEFGPDSNATTNTAAIVPAAAKRDAEEDKRWCLWHGQSCWKKAKRAEAEADAADAAAEEDKRWCLWHGQSCWKAKRAAEAVVSTIESFEPEARSVAFEPIAKTALSKDRRSADPEAWCLWHGQSCWKREADASVEARCNAPGGACTAARRDLHAMYAAARSVIDAVDSQ